MEPVIMELERKETVVVVGHQAVLRYCTLPTAYCTLHSHTAHCTLASFITGACLVTSLRWRRT